MAKRHGSKTLLLLLSILTLSGGWLTPAPVLRPASVLKALTEGDDGPLSPIEARKKQIDELSARIKELEQEAKEVDAETSKPLAFARTAFLEAKEKLQSASQEEVEYINKVLSALSTRIKYLGLLSEPIVEARDVANAHIKIIDSMIAALAKRREKKEKKYKWVYSIKELKDLQGKITATKNDLRTEESIFDRISRKKRSKEEELAGLQKETAQLHSTLREPGLATEPVDLIKLRLEASSERENFITAGIRKLGIEIAMRKDAIILKQIEYDELRKDQMVYQANLIVSESDIERTLKSLEEEKKRAAREISSFNSRLAERKRLRRDEKETLAEVEKKLKDLQQREKEPEAQGQLVRAREQRSLEQIAAYDREIDLLDIKRGIEEVKIEQNTLSRQFMNIVDTLQKGNFERRDVEKWLNDLTNARAKVESELRSLALERTQASLLLNESTRKIEEFTKKVDNLKEDKEEIFKAQGRLLVETQAAYRDAINALSRQSRALQESLSLYNIDVEAVKKDLRREYDFLINLVEQKRVFDIWRRSPGALSLRESVKAARELKEFFLEILWYIPTLFNPFSWVRFVKQFGVVDGLGFLLLVALFLLFLLLLGRLFGTISRVLTRRISDCERGSTYLLYNIAASLATVVQQHHKLFGLWAFLQLDIAINFKRFFGPLGRFASYLDSQYLVAIFYVASIPVLVYLARCFIVTFRDLNERLGFAFFTENFESRLEILLNIALYSAAVLLPLRQAFIAFHGSLDSMLPAFALALFTLILQVAAVMLLFFNKEDLVKLIPTTNWVWHKLIQFVEQNAPFIFLFVLSLLVLSNPYVGYSNLAFLLMYAVPVTVLVVYGLLGAHYYVRQYCVAWFLIEEDEEVTDRFEHAKTYYGIFIILSFLFLALLSFMAVAELWGVTNSYELIKYLLTERWTIEITETERIGVVEFVRFIMYIAGGFLFSTLIDKFVLNKIFDILRMDLGLRNTISSLLHYLILYFVIVIGLSAVYLGRTVIYFSTAAFAGIAFASQDLLRDLLAGLLVLLERPIEIGSFIQTGDKKGTVIKITPRATTIRNLYHHSIVIPNRELMAHPISNWGFNRVSVGFDVELTVAYGEDPVAVRAVLKDVVESDPRILRVPRVIYRLNDFSENGMKFLIRAFISARRVREQWDIAADLRIGLFSKLVEGGIKLAYPHRILHLSGEDGSAKALKKVISVSFDEDKPE